MKRWARTIQTTARLQALADPARLRMVAILEASELSVGELAKVVQLPQSTVSRHLKALSDAEWVIRRSEGTASLYRVLLDELSPEARAIWLGVRDSGVRPTDREEDRRRLEAVLAERRLDTQAFFGRVAGEWDEIRSALFGTIFSAGALLSLLPRNWVVADLGCGTGNASELLAPVVERVVAVDASEPMIQAARKRLEQAPNVEFVRGSLEAIPLADASVDAAVILLVLHHLEDPGSAVREARRILRSDRGGGTLLIVDMVEHSRNEYRHTMGHRHLGFSPGAVERLCAASGFVETRVRVLPGDAEAKGPGLFAATAVINR